MRKVLFNEENFDPKEEDPITPSSCLSSIEFEEIDDKKKERERCDEFKRNYMRRLKKKCAYDHNV
jgi:hypothetical protein